MGPYPKSVGLGGDGDEISAISDVEQAFGVTLDYADVPRWRTAGDVFVSLCKVLPAEEQGRSDLWARFARALCLESGVDPETIEAKSPLLAHSLMHRFFPPHA